MPEYTRDRVDRGHLSYKWVRQLPNQYTLDEKCIVRSRDPDKQLRGIPDLTGCITQDEIICQPYLLPYEKTKPPKSIMLA